MTGILRANQITIPTEVQNGEMMPSTWDPIWPKYASRLTPQQVAAFQAMPEDLARYAQSMAAPVMNKYIGQPNAEASVAAVQVKLDSLLSGISAKPPTITTRAQINAAL